MPAVATSSTFGEPAFGLHHQQRAFAGGVERARVGIEPERIDACRRSNATDLGAGIRADGEHRVTHRDVELVILRIVDQSGWFRGIQSEAIGDLELRIVRHASSNRGACRGRRRDCDDLMNVLQGGKHQATLRIDGEIARPATKLDCTR